MIGTAGVVGGSVGLLATGHLFVGTVVVTAFVLFDLLDGAMARARGYGTDFGVVLDASCDRIADGALLGSLAFYAFAMSAHTGRSQALGTAALIALVSAQVVSYVKARADSVDLKVGGALAERAERNVIALVGAGLGGSGCPACAGHRALAARRGLPDHRRAADGSGAARLRRARAAPRGGRARRHPGRGADQQ